MSLPSGYDVFGLAFSGEEFEYLRSAITDQYSTRLKSLLPNGCPDFLNHIREDFPPSLYHEISHNVDHVFAWPKSQRILGVAFFDWFIESSLFKRLLEIWGPLEITDEEGLGYGNIYWRLSRPFELTDVGPMHRDSWFWELDDSQKLPEYPFDRIKTWIGVQLEPGKNGLLVYPRSHLVEDVSWDRMEKHGRIKPVLKDQRYVGADALLLQMSNNSAVVFDDNLIHGGAVNRGSYTRISLEFTSFLRR